MTATRMPVEKASAYFEQFFSGVQSCSNFGKNQVQPGKENPVSAVSYA